MHRHRHLIAIGGVVFDLRLTGGGMKRRIRERYRGFFLDDPPAAEPRFGLSFEIDPDAPRFHAEWVDNPPVSSRGDLEAAVVEGQGLRAEFDWRSGRASARIPDSLAHVDLVLRIALGGVLLREGGTLLHSAAVRRDGWGLLFAGPSGAGKSTLADLCRSSGVEVLADEMVVVRSAGRGVRIHGTPFWNGSGAAAPAGGVFLLRQSPVPRVESLEPGRALAGLLESGGAPLDLPAMQRAFFDTVSCLLRRLPAYRLSFARHPGFWAAIDRQPEFAFFRPRPRLAGSPRPATGAPPRLPSLDGRN